MAESVLNVAGILRVRLPALPESRDALGRFTSAQRAQRSRNGLMAVRLQAGVLSHIESRITRRGASTGRLLNITAASQNAQYDTWSIGVGNVPFLNGSFAKYWRTFEEGSAGLWKHPFIGTQLMPKGPGTAPRPVAHGMVPGIRTTRATLPWMDGRRWVVKHEIAPRHAYRDAANEAHLAQFGIDSARAMVREILGRPVSA